MGQIGRPRVLADEQKRRTVCAMISAGAGIEAAARLVGCSMWTVRREAQRDEDFAQQLREAEASAELTPLRAIRHAAGTHWRAAAWLLERTCPERFAPRPARSIALAEIDSLFDKTALALAEEFTDAAQRERVLKRLQEVHDEQFGGRRSPATEPPHTEVDRLIRQALRS